MLRLRVPRRLSLRLVRLLLLLLRERLPVSLSLEALSLEALSLEALFLVALSIPLRLRLGLRKRLAARELLRKLAAVRDAVLRSVRLGARLRPVRLRPAVLHLAVPGLLLGAVLRPPGLPPRLPARRALRGRVRGLPGNPGRAAVTGQHNAFVRGPSGRVLLLIPLSAVRHRDSYMWNVLTYRTSVHATG
ncbi:hypothetical protein ACFV0C_08575 [Streptomyces sp. NPDC059568]|uniref:hypothetical protein n=1 Tax=Streptomyces sp. NPDC059568 TaxID=3346868 RepID=UPI0036CB37C8